MIDELRERQLAQQARLETKVEMLGDEATISVLQDPPRNVILLISAATGRVRIPAFQFDKDGHLIAEVQKIYYYRHGRDGTGISSFDNRGWDDLVWWFEEDFIPDYSVRPLPEPIKPISMINDPRQLNTLVEWYRAREDEEFG